MTMRERREEERNLKRKIETVYREVRLIREEKEAGGAAAASLRHRQSQRR